MDGLIFFPIETDSIVMWMHTITTFEMMASHQANKDKSRTFVLEDENDNSLIIVFIH
jgi:hypothetical protein